MKYLLLIIGLATIHPSSAQSITVGQTYPIAEPNALIEIRQKAQQITPEQIAAEREKAFEKWLQQFRVTDLARAGASVTRAHIPFGENPAPIYRADMSILYPKGFRFNPLKYVTVRERFFIIDSTDISWVKPQLKETDKVILNKGELNKVKAQLQRPVYILDQLSIEKLGIRYVPSLIQQKGDVFEVQEFKL